MSVKQQVVAFMRELRSRSLPDSAAIVEETFRRLSLTSDKTSASSVRREFEHHLRATYSECLQVLEEFEDHSYASGIPERLATLRAEDVKAAERIADSSGFNAGVVSLLSKWYPYLRLAFLSIAQSRKARGGRDFELQVERLLTLAHVPFETQTKKERTDIVFPSQAFLERYPNRGAMATLKRTLRERWREVVEELQARKIPATFLLTADDNISETKARTITEYRIYLVVWRHVKEKIGDMEMVISYDDWLHDHLLDLARHWQ